MANFQTCINGHNYDAAQFPNCPYCPVNSRENDYEKTVTDFKNTQLFDETGQQFKKTQINEETSDFKTTPVAGLKSAEHPFKRTSIVGDDATPNTGQNQVQKRRLVGWLVSFSQDEMGEDFKLFAGKNKIGSAAACDIQVKDSSVSAEQATILFRENEFLIKDSFSTNGTRINGVIVDEGKLKEGDELKLGNTVFKFKTVF